MSWWSKLVGVVTNTKEKTIRARNDKGQYVSDDKATPDIDEAYKTIRVKKAKKK
tara:strand:+ start:1084 stop:1245 length:162 start_codon:yes stop_codon:yes gene_type:complete